MDSFPTKTLAIILCHKIHSIMPIPSGQSNHGCNLQKSVSCQSCLTLHDHMDCSQPGSSVHGDSLGKNTGVDCHFLLQGIFLTQGSNPGLLHCRKIPYPLSYQNIVPNEKIKSPIRILSLIVCLFSLQLLFFRTNIHQITL